MNIRWLSRAANAGSNRRLPIQLALAAGSCLATLTLLSLPAKAVLQPVKDLGNGDWRVFLDKVINGISPAGNGAWMSVDLRNTANGAVSILLNPNADAGEGVTGLTANEYISKVGLNLTKGASIPDPFTSPANPVVTCIEQTAGATICSNFGPNDWTAKVNGYDIEGNAVSGFDLGIDLDGTGRFGASGRLSNGKTVKFILSGTTLRAADLLGTLSVKGFDVNIAAKVQGISSSEGSTSGVIADPFGNGTTVPGPLPLLGAVSAFQASRRLRRRLNPVSAIAQSA